MGIGEFGMRNSSSSLVILYPVFSSLLQLRVQPFFHHPFAVPAEYEGVFPKGNKAIRQCIGYTDHALKLFFEKVYERTVV